MSTEASVAALPAANASVARAPASRLVLGLETGGEHLSAALMDGSHLMGEVRAHRGKKHLDLMLGLIASLMERHEVTPAHLGLIAVSRGPGGFTGVRLGLSIAQGLSIASGVPVWPVSSLASLALNAVVPETVVCALLDAKKAEVYAALYRLRAGASPLTLLAPHTTSCESALVAAREAAGQVERMVVLGSGALAYGVASPLGAGAHVASAVAVAELAQFEWAEAGFDAAAAPPVDPTYLRKSEAEVMADARDAMAGRDAANGKG